eukprot:3528392-Rhodomonas_salina.1
MTRKCIVTVAVGISYDAIWHAAVRGESRSSARRWLSQHHHGSMVAVLLGLLLLLVLARIACPAGSSSSAWILTLVNQCGRIWGCGRSNSESVTFLGPSVGAGPVPLVGMAWASCHSMGKPRLRNLRVKDRRRWRSVSDSELELPARPEAFKASLGLGGTHRQNFSAPALGWEIRRRVLYQFRVSARLGSRASE